MTDYGLKVSKEGKGITDSDYDMSLTSKFNNLTVYKTGTVSVATTTDIAIPDYTSYEIPIFMVWFKGYGDTKWYQAPTYGTWHGSDHHIECWMTLGYGLRLYTNCDGSQNDTFKYIIFNEKMQSN